MSAATATILAVAVPAIAAGATIAGATMTSSGVKDAAKTQAKSTADALAYEKERDAYARSTEANRYGTMMSQNAPYVASGAAANTAMASYMGLPPPAAKQPIQATGSGAAQALGMPGLPGTTTGPMITMRAPTGETKQVPASELNHWLQKGATQVG